MNEMTLRVPVMIKSKVTEELKQDMISELTKRLEMLDQDLLTIEGQGKRILSEQAKIDAQGLPALSAQIEEEKQKRVAFKEEVAAQLKEAEGLEIGSEIVRMQAERVATVKIGDDLNKVFGAEILLEDGKIVAFRN